MLPLNPYPQPGLATPVSPWLGSVGCWSDTALNGTGVDVDYV